MENKTVEVDGMVYEIGKYYLFSDSPSSVGVYDELKGVNIKAGNYRFTSAIGATWRHCNIAIGELGTITPAPIKLVDGAAYEFDYNDDRSIVGVLSSSMKYGSMHRMLCTPKREYNSDYCTNITRLVPEVK